MLDRVKANLHVIVCMSPVGVAFRNRIRMYPALINCTTIDMFHQWQQEALLEVGERYLAGVNLEGNEQVYYKFNSISYFLALLLIDYNKQKSNRKYLTRYFLINILVVVVMVFICVFCCCNVKYLYVSNSIQSTNMLYLLQFQLYKEKDL